MSTVTAAPVGAVQSVDSKPIGMRKNGELKASAGDALKQRDCKFPLLSDSVGQENNGTHQGQPFDQKPATLVSRSAKQNGKLWIQSRPRRRR